MLIIGNNNMKTKICPDCKIEKPVEEFYRRGDGTAFSYCKPCSKLRVKIWDHENRMRRRLINQQHMRRKRRKIVVY